MIRECGAGSGSQLTSREQWREQGEQIRGPVTGGGAQPGSGHPAGGHPWCRGEFPVTVVCKQASQDAADLRDLCLPPSPALPGPQEEDTASWIPKQRQPRLATGQAPPGAQEDMSPLAGAGRSRGSGGSVGVPSRFTPGLARARPRGDVSRKQDGAGGQSVSRSYVTFGIGDFSEVFPPLLLAEGYPFLPSVNPGPGAQLLCFWLAVCLSPGPALPCFPPLAALSEAAQACGGRRPGQPSATTWPAFRSVPLNS